MSRLIGIRIIVWIYLLNITGVVVRGQIGGPNAVASTSGQTTLDCNTSNLARSIWIRTTDGSSDEVEIAYGCGPVTGGNAAYYRTEVQGNICRLIIANATMQQAGVYACNDGVSSVYRSLVTIIDPAASIVVYNQSEVVDGDQLNISCSITYYAQTSPAPSLHPLPSWTTSPGQIFNSTVYNSSINVVTVMATVRVQKPIVPIFQCTTVFEITGYTNGYNSTPPADNLTAGYTTELYVHYAVSIPVITSKPEVIAIDGVSCGIVVLTCSSAGNPAPNYRWYDSAENVILTTTNTLTLAEVNRIYICEVDNTIRGVRHNESVTYRVSESNCASIVQCCVFPRDETTSVMVGGCDNGTSCDCSRGYGGITLTCNAKTFPNSSYMWEVEKRRATDYSVYEVTGDGLYRCTAYFNEASSNYTGDVKFSNGTNETYVDECSEDPITTLTQLSTTTRHQATTCNGTDCPSGTDEPPPNAAIIAGIVIGVFVIANIVAMCLFFWYYKKVEVSHSGTSIRSNKLKLDRRFTWLKKMMPCVSDTKDSAGSNCLWVSLFILLGTVTGIVTFPIWIILANKYEKNNETSALTNKRENGDGNGSGENGRRPANISSLTNHRQPPPTNQMNAIRREDPYQNESSRENIELNNSLRSRNHLLPVSQPQSRPPPAGRPPPPPNKPIMNLSNSRPNDYTANDQTQSHAAANPEHTTYADLPFVPRNTLPTATPVQFLNVSNDTYAELNKT